MAEERRTRYFTNEMKKWFSYQQKVRDRDNQQTDEPTTQEKIDLYQKALEKSKIGAELQKEKGLSSS